MINKKMIKITDKFELQKKLKFSVWVSLPVKLELKKILKYLNKQKQNAIEEHQMSLTIFNKKYFLTKRQVITINKFLVNRRNRIKYKTELSRKIDPKTFTLFDIIKSKQKKNKMDKFLLYFKFDPAFICDILNLIFSTKGCFLKSELSMTLVLAILEKTSLIKIQENPYTIDLNLLNILTMLHQKKKNIFAWNLELAKHQAKLQACGMIFISYLLTNNILIEKTNRIHKNGKLILRNTLNVFNSNETTLYQEKYGAIIPYTTFSFSWNPSFEVKKIKTNTFILKQKFVINDFYLSQLHSILLFKNNEALYVVYPEIAEQLKYENTAIQTMCLSFFFDPRISLKETLNIIDFFKEENNKIKALIYKLNTKRELIYTLFSEAYLYCCFEYFFLPFLYDLRGRLYFLSCFAVSSAALFRDILLFYNPQGLEQRNSNNLVIIDAVSSHLQCLYLLTRSKKISTMLYIDKKDIYDDISKKMLHFLFNNQYYHTSNKQSTIKISCFFEKDHIVQFTTRKIIKKIIMLSSYNAGIALITQQLIKEQLLDFDKRIIKKLIILTKKIFLILYPEMTFVKKLLNYIAHSKKKVRIKTTQIDVTFKPKIYKFQYYTKYTGLANPKRGKYYIITDKLNKKALEIANVANVLQALDADLNFSLLTLCSFPVKPLHDGYFLEKIHSEPFLLNTVENLNNASKKNYLKPFITQIKYRKRLQKELFSVITSYNFHIILNTNSLDFSFAYKQEI